MRLGPPGPKHQHNIIGDKIVSYHRNVVMHQFAMGDVEDPEIYAGQPIWEWQQTDYGKWCMQNALDVRFHIMADLECYGYKCRITGDLEEKMYTFWVIRYNGPDSKRT